MTSPFRLPSGGRIDRARPLSFTFDGVRYGGFQGDTLASALIASGVHLVGRWVEPQAVARGLPHNAVPAKDPA